jgi:hypothetical protein
VPNWLTRQCSITAIKSAMRTVDMRWLTMIAAAQRADGGPRFDRHDSDDAAP